MKKLMIVLFLALFVFTGCKEEEPLTYVSTRVGFCVNDKNNSSIISEAVEVFVFNSESDEPICYLLNDYNNYMEVLLNVNKSYRYEAYMLNYVVTGTFVTSEYEDHKAVVIVFDKYDDPAM